MRERPAPAKAARGSRSFQVTDCIEEIGHKQPYFYLGEPAHKRVRARREFLRLAAVG